MADEFSVRLKCAGYVNNGQDLYLDLYCDGPGATSRVYAIIPEGCTVGYIKDGWSDWQLKPDGAFTFFSSPTYPRLMRVSGLQEGFHRIGVKVIHTTNETLYAYAEVSVCPVERPPLPYKPTSVIKWEAVMLKEGAKWADPTKDFGSFGYDGSVQFYDGAYVFFQAHDYTGLPVFIDSAWNIAGQWADYVLKMHAANPTGSSICAGWRVFTDGLREAYRRSGDEKYRDAIYILCDMSPAGRHAKYLSDIYMREMSYGLEAYINAELCGRERDPKMKRIVDLLLSMIDWSCVSDQAESLQHFMLGLCASALIKYWDLTKDERVPPAIYKFLRWSKDVGWNFETQKMRWKWQPAYTEDTTLINLVAHAFSWYAWHTGDHEMREHGRLIFEHSFDTPLWGGKMYSQNFQKSFRFVKEMFGIDHQGYEAPYGFPEEKKVVWRPENRPTVEPVDDHLELPEPAHREP